MFLKINCIILALNNEQYTTIYFYMSVPIFMLIDFFDMWASINKDIIIVVVLVHSHDTKTN